MTGGNGRRPRPFPPVIQYARNYLTTISHEFIILGLHEFSEPKSGTI